MITFGFECEFVGNLQPFLNSLETKGLIQEARLHGYHCDCPACDVRSQYVFRAQRDSTVGGEIISTVFNTEAWDMALDAMHQLQEAAIDHDATLSTDCGLHVHLGGDVESYSAANKAWLAAEAAMWESGIAMGVFGAQRGGNVRMARRVVDIMGYDYDLWSSSRHSREPGMELPLVVQNESKAWLTGEFRDTLDHRLDDTSQWMDRHSDFVQTSHGGIYEMRVFNATRVAWRMEMACRVAVALVSPEVCDVLAPLFDEWLWSSFETGASSGLLAAKELFQRKLRLMQLGWQNSRGHMGPAMEPPMTGEALVAVLSAHDERLGELLMKQTGYNRARVQFGSLQFATITNNMNPADHNHADVLALLAEPATVVAV